MLIPCPACGPRETSEFAYIGDGTVTRPSLDAPAEAWVAAIYDRANPLGLQRELWLHLYGCRCIVRVTRDTGTHAISGAELIGDDATAFANTDANASKNADAKASKNDGVEVSQ